MEYTKPVIVAQNNENGSFAAACGSKDHCRGGISLMPSGCKNCERTK